MIEAIKVAMGRLAMESRREVAESASERLDEIAARKQKLEAQVDRVEEEATAIQIDMVGEEGDDLHEMREDAQRLTAAIQRDGRKLDTLRDLQKEQYDEVLEQEQRTEEAVRSVGDLARRALDANRWDKA